MPASPVRAGRLTDQLCASGKRLAADLGDLIRVHRAYASTEKDFDAVNAKLKSDQEAVTKVLLDAPDRLKAQITKEEWTGAFAAPKE